MRDSIRLGRVAGFPVGIHWSVIGVAALLTWSLATLQLPSAAPGLAAEAYLLVAVLAAGGFFGSLLAHELAHALVARRWGIPTDGITLWFLGGVAKLRGEAPSARAELQIAGVGPLTSLVIGLVVGLGAWVAHLADVGDLVVTGLWWLGVVNVVLAVFNLIPAAPLDGGRVLAAGLWAHWGDRTRAAVVAARAGQGLGVALVGLSILGTIATSAVGGLWTLVMGVFLLQSATGEGRAAQIRGRLAQRTVRDVMAPTGVANDWWTVDDLVRHGPPGAAHLPLVLRDWSGAPSGLLPAGAATRVPAEWRPSVRLRDLALRPDQVRTAWPDEPVLVALTRPGPDDAPLVAVDGGRIVGVVSVHDLARAIDGSPPARPAPPVFVAR